MRQTTRRAGSPPQATGLPHHLVLTIRSRRVALPDGVRPASIRIRNGIIDAIGEYDAPFDDDFGDLAILPGLVDTHVHINEPGRTEWEGFDTATRAAAAGGITTLIEMPLNSIPATTSVEAYEQKRRAAEGRCWVDIGFWGGLVPGNAGSIGPLLDAGCFGFKCFLTPSGVDEFPHVTAADLWEAAPELARRGAVLMAHAELPERLEPQSGDPREYANYLRSRPRLAEDDAIALLIRLARETGCRVHIVHLSSSDSIRQLRDAQPTGITVETCPHYLTFAAEEIADGATEFKCAPPIRESVNRDLLWDALRDGLIRFVVSDHSPSPPAMKQGDFFTAWGGIASLELGLPVMWTEARKRGATLNDIREWMSTAPARLAGLDHRKGSIAPGFDADLVVFDPDAEWTVDASRLQQRHKLTPYAGRPLTGMVRQTYLRGVPIDFDKSPTGQILRSARLGSLNAAPPDEALADFLKCCGSRIWAERMTAARPFATLVELEQTAERIWSECSPEDWLEAFAAHPKIGESSANRWSRQEQSAAAGASVDVHAALAEANREYEAKFGYIFIVCATGKTAGEMLAILRERLPTPADDEIHNAAREQQRITRLRLRKLLIE